MKLLRETIRKIILESPESDDFIEWWVNKENRVKYDNWNRMDFTKHEDMLAQHPEESKTNTSPKSFVIPDAQQIKRLVQDKRAIKQYWNENCDRAFWQSGKVKFFHSLNYYESGISSHKLSTGIAKEDDMANLNIKGFFRKYKLENNKDEMSTYGIYDGQPPSDSISREVFTLGVLIEGRVTFAHAEDVMSESRSKATAADYKAHQSSGMPKRMPPGAEYIGGLLFTEADCREKGINECILDNWSIKTIVIEKGTMRKWKESAVREYAAELGINVLYSHEVV